MRYNQHRQIELGYRLRHRERFAAARDAHQRLELFACAQLCRQPLYRFRLVTGRLKLAVYLKFTHFLPLRARTLLILYYFNHKLH
jgi:hypothetical protein